MQLQTIQCEKVAKALVIKPTIRRIDAAVVPAFRTEVLRSLVDVTVVVVDMSEVDGVDSTGLGSFVSILKALPPSSEVRLVGVKPLVRKLLELTRLSRIFVEYPAISSAIAA